MGTVTFYIFVVVACLYVTRTSSIECHPKGKCSCEMSDGSGTIDLSPISNASPPRFKGIKETESPDFTFQYDPCKTFSNHKCDNVFVCQVYKSNIDQYDAGKQFGVKISTSNKIQFIYNSVPEKRTTTVTLICDPNAKDDKLEPFSEPPLNPDHYFTTLTSKYACPIKGSWQKKEKKKRISTGTVLCIMLLVGIVLYLAIGMVVNKYARKKEGKELVPNVSFWTDFPSLVKDGCVFSYGKVRGKPNEYERI